MAVPSLMSPIFTRSSWRASQSWSVVSGESVYALEEKRTTPILSEVRRSMNAWMTGLMACRRFSLSPSFS